MCAECAKKASPSPMWRNIRNILLRLIIGFSRLSIIIYIYYTRPSKLRSELVYLYSKSFYFKDGISSISKYKDLIVRVTIVTLSFPLYRIRVNIIID